MKLSILMPFVAHRPEQLLSFAALAQWSGAARIWHGHSAILETGQGFAFTAGAGFRVPVGIGVTLMPLRHPFEAAHQARSLSTTLGQPVTLGIGPGAAAFQASLLGEAYRSPLTAVREYVTIVRELCDGVEVDRAGEYYRCRGSLPAPLRGTVEVGIGVLRPKMARLAGEIAERAITWLTPPAYLRDVIGPAIAEGAGSDRSVPVTAMVPLALHRPGRDAERLAVVSARMHLQAPHYVDMLRTAGVEVSGRADPADGRSLIDSGTFVYGRLDDVAAGLDAYRQAGVSELVLNLTATAAEYGHEAALEDLKVLMAKLAHLGVAEEGSVMRGTAA